MPKKLIEQAIKTLPKNTSKEIKDFIWEFFADIPKEDLNMMTSSMMIKAAKLHLDVAKKRKNGKPVINIETPTLKEQREGDYQGTVIDVINDDLVFLIDSVAAALTKHGYIIRLLIHPLTQQGDKTTSHIHIELKNALHKEETEALEKELYDVIDDVVYATSDWQLMKAKIKEAQASLNKASNHIQQKELDEYVSFLEYLYKDNFTLLGYREYKFAEKNKKITSETVQKKSLGLLRGDKRPAYITDNKEGLPETLQKLRKNLPPISIGKVNQRSTVHRAVPMDAIAVKLFDSSGNIKGEALFIGLFTSVTYSRSVEDIPYIRHKVRKVMELSQQKTNSHDYRALKHILEKYPRDEMFQIDPKDLYETSKSILRLQERQRIALFNRRDPFGRYISCLVYVPRDRFDTGMRLKIQDILNEELEGKCTNFHTTLDDSPLARVLYYISIKQQEKPKTYNFEKIEKLLQEAGRTWSEKLTDAIYEKHQLETKAIELIKRYRNAFPVGYQDQYRPEKSVHDIFKIEEAIEKKAITLELYHCKYMDQDELRLKAYNPGIAFTLSEMLPILRNIGFTVISEAPYKVTPNGIDHDVWVHDYRLKLADKHAEKQFDIAKHKDNYEDALSKVIEQTCENDVLNKLVFSANMTWKEISVIRGYARYLRQANLPYSLQYMMRAITDNPHIARHLISLFNSIFDPALQDKAEILAAKHTVQIDKDLEAVESLDQDRIMRALLTVVNATVRTNAYQRLSNGEIKNYISYKIDSRKVDFLPNPKPFREIFVYSPRVEGIHLRGDKIARGGLRWSDRHEDFRTEVLGLMKAQLVKNAVIVPVGSKGGFVVKKPPQTADRMARLEEGIECYKLFIRGLLDITDNTQGKKIIPPKQVVRLDEDDPYLVVAADKGTATFSDIANSLSQEYGFWLGDAFASGGSAGYDHKKMGITARGAWESVKRHFRELNHNTQTQPFDVVGVGDMAGDVFGNGMLLSEQIRLVGAFNHLHIFCDPDPDPASSFKERQRLFDKVKGWEEYNTKLLSKGGKIFHRSEKSLVLTEEIKKRFNIKSDKVTPNELIRSMLKTRTDLLWFGGIGTYIKSSKETHLDVGDKSNDSLRIDSKDVKASVIGEGANLAITHAGRIEYAQNGGKVNADFIDNSGGVDSSDHEVNIKILFTDIMSDKKHNITIAKRNTILEKMTEEVAQHVLDNNYQQSQAVSLMELQASDQIREHANLITHMEKSISLDRKLEKLPSIEEIDQRMTAGKGLTRPELSTLQAYAKIELTEKILNTDIPDQESTKDLLFTYFPEPLRKKYDKEIMRHRLKREIIATILANSLINRLGPTFIQKTADKTGATIVEIAKAYFVVRSAFNIPETLKAIEAMDNEVPAQVQLKAMREIAKMVEHATNWMLTRLGRPIDLEEDIKTLSKGVQSLEKILPEIICDHDKEEMSARHYNWHSNGLSDELALKIALMPILTSAFDIIHISSGQNATIKKIASVYFNVGNHFHMNWLRSQAGYIKPSSKWSADALSGMINQIYGCQAGLTSHIIESTTGTPDKVVDNWIKNNQHKATQVQSTLKDMRTSMSIDLPMLVIAEQNLRNLFGG